MSASHSSRVSTMQWLASPGVARLGCVRVSVPRDGVTQLNIILGLIHFHFQYPGDDVNRWPYLPLTTAWLCARLCGGHWTRHPRRGLPTPSLVTLQGVTLDSVHTHISFADCWHRLFLDNISRIVISLKEELYRVSQKKCAHCFLTITPKRKGLC